MSSNGSDDSTLLCINAGSSSVKISVYTYNQQSHRLQLRANKSIKLKNNDKSSEQILKDDKDIDLQHVTVIAHRIVQGGYQLIETTVVDDKSRRLLDEASALDPLHNPPAIKWLDVIDQAMHELKRDKSSYKQVLTFDTTFFREMQIEAQTYPLPKQLTEKYHIIRYGFHGFAHQSMLQWYHENVHTSHRLISCQLGSGCSITAVNGKQIVDHSMGFTSLEGLIMATRTGSIDPSIVFYLHRQAKMSIDDIEQLLYYKSGLLGLSDDKTNDMEQLLKTEGSDKNAKLAVTMFVYSIVKTIAGYIAIMGGVDAVIFGGGIGEHAAEIRKRVLDGLAVFNFAAIEEDANKQGEDSRCVTQKDSSKQPQAYVHAVDEAAIMAQEAVNVIKSS